MFLLVLKRNRNTLQRQAGGIGESKLLNLWKTGVTFL
jgi:hypothetical protein